MHTDYPVSKKPGLLTGMLFSMLIGAIGVILIGVFLAKQSLNTHFNLYYLMWKSGMRLYEREVALQGMIHDDRFRKSLAGISSSELESRFPSTFFEMRHLPPTAKGNQRYFIDDYAQAQRADGSINFVWHVMFEDDKLVELEICKP